MHVKTLIPIKCVCLEMGDSRGDLTEASLRLNTVVLWITQAFGFRISFFTFCPTAQDHDMKERICLEMERLGCHAVVMGSKGFGATRRASRRDARMGSVSDYCVHHCGVPIVVVRLPGTDAPPVAERKDMTGHEHHKQGGITPIGEESAEVGPLGRTVE